MNESYVRNLLMQKMAAKKQQQAPQQQAPQQQGQMMPPGAQQMMPPGAQQMMPQQQGPSPKQQMYMNQMAENQNMTPPLPTQPQELMMQADSMAPIEVLTQIYQRFAQLGQMIGSNPYGINDALPPLMETVNMLGQWIQEHTQHEELEDRAFQMQQQMVRQQAQQNQMWRMANQPQPDQSMMMQQQQQMPPQMMPQQQAMGQQQMMPGQQGQMGQMPPGMM